MRTRWLLAVSLLLALFALPHEVRAQGFRGGYRSVARVLAPWRHRKLGRKRRAATAAAPSPAAPPALTARQMA